MPAPQTLVRSKAPRFLLILVAVVGLAVVASRADFRPNLAHVHVRLLSGAPEGNYHAVADQVAAAAAKKGGQIENVVSEGSQQNIDRLVGARRTCDVQAALVQAGLPFPLELEVIARLAKAESLLLLGRSADTITAFAQLRGLRVGVGPEGSGTAQVMSQILASRDLKDLGVVASHHPLAEQIDLAAAGALDLAAFVMDEDAALVQAAVRERGLQIAGFPHADVVARQFRFLRKGRIGAGEYDSVRMLPPVDKEVLRVDTLVLGNGCARRSQVMGLLAALSDVFPDLVRHNKETPNTTGLPVAPAAQSWIDSGPELLDAYFPRVSDVMPPSNWVHLMLGVSVLFNALGLANRVVLWRIDAARVRAEQEIARCFGPGSTLGDIARLTPSAAPLRQGTVAEVERVIAELEALAARSRKLSLTVLVPMGGEMLYRYQESLIHERLAVLRAFLERWRGAPL
jgi:TRAP-type uncharacterized transport system substrate-binding protein